MMMKNLLMLFLIAISTAAFGQGSQLSQLDGEWYSTQWKYGYTLTNGVGVATSTNSPKFKVGDRIIFLQQISDKSFEGTQIYTDGMFYKITVQQQSNDTLFFKGEKNITWTMTKKTQTTAQAAPSTTSTTAAPVNSASTASPARTSSLRNLNIFEYEEYVKQETQSLQSKLPACQGDNHLKWDMCFGTYRWTVDQYNALPFVNAYIGEWKSGKYHGQGSLNNSNFETSVYRGTFRNGLYVSEDQTAREKANELLRVKAQNDVVAQALNYVSGHGEDAKGENFYYPVERNNGNCIFQSTAKSDIIVDLTKGNPNAIQFFTQGAQGNTYITRVDGLPEFRCNGCNGDRVQRAWALIYRECKGTRKAF